MYNNAVILITGGTGSWGWELATQLLQHNPKKIMIMSRNETVQVEMSRWSEDKRLNFCIGDVRDKESLLQLFENVDYVFHLAALKHVPVCETQPLEALKTNVIGTQNVIEAAIDKKVKKVVFVSTDKAADPVNFYGMTKAIGEKLTIYGNLLNAKTRFICIRGGNVFGTNGSVLQLFMDQVKKKNEIHLTDKRMTRFFVTRQEAAKLLIQAAEVGLGGETFIMSLPTCRIADLAEVMAERYGNANTRIIETGARPGEKLHEVLVSEMESHHTIRYNEKLYILLPTIDIPGLKQHYSSYSRLKPGTIHSNGHLMSKEDIWQMMVDSGYADIT